MLHRFGFVLFLIGTFFCVTAKPCFAGELMVVNGKTVWRSTQCPAPQMPTSLSGNPETPANNMNGEVVAYNDYSKAAQSYMNCISEEAQRDATATSQSIIASAQGLIDQERKKVFAVGTPLRANRR